VSGLCYTWQWFGVCFMLPLAKQSSSLCVALWQLLTGAVRSIRHQRNCTCTQQQALALEGLQKAVLRNV
jgi:hypothetical protein